MVVVLPLLLDRVDGGRNVEVWFKSGVPSFVKSVFIVICSCGVIVVCNEEDFFDGYKWKCEDAAAAVLNLEYGGCGVDFIVVDEVRVICVDDDIVACWRKPVDERGYMN